MDIRFLRAFAHTMQFEGGYVNDPVDPGGETNLGISKRSYPDLDIKSLTYPDVMPIYYQDFWMPAKADQIRSDEVAIKYFDMAINMGQNRAVKLMQQAVNSFQQCDALVVDGAIGPKTLAAINGCVTVIMPWIRKAQTDFYLGLIERNPKLAAFKKGWLRRAAQ